MEERAVVRIISTADLDVSIDMGERCDGIPWDHKPAERLEVTLYVPPERMDQFGKSLTEEE